MEMMSDEDKDKLWIKRMCSEFNPRVTQFKAPCEDKNTHNLDDEPDTEELKCPEQDIEELKFLFKRPSILV